MRLLNLGGNVIEGNTALTGGAVHVFRYESTGSAYKFYIDGNEETFSVVSGSNDGSWFSTEATSITLYSIGAIRRSTGTILYHNGPINNLSVLDTDLTTVLLNVTGLGTSVTAWEDTIGSNDGTESGTFTRELVSASDANDQIDAYGTAISEPRLNTQQINLFGDGEYSSTPDSASLDLTTAATWEIWCEPIFLSSERPLISKFGTTGESSWELQVDVTSARLAFLMAGADGNFQRTEYWSLNTQGTSMLSVTFDGGVVKLYQDAALLTFLGFAGASAPTTLNAGTLPVIMGGRPVNGNIVRTFGGKFGSTKIYNVALTADEVLTNYNTQKSLYVTNGAAFSAEAQNYFDRLDVANDTTYIPYKQPLANYIDGLVTLGGAYWDTMKSAASFVGVGIKGITVPLRDGMTAITNNNFVTGDLNQLTGLKSDMAAKYLDTGTIGSDYEQNDCSMSTYMTSTTSWTTYIMGVGGFGSGTFAILAKNGEILARQMNATAKVLDSDAATFTGFVGTSRTTSTGFDGRANSITTPQTQASQIPQTTAMSVFTASAQNNTTDARLATYHVGPALNLATLEGLQATLISEIAAI
jgi:hypothetical protein